MRRVALVVTLALIAAALPVFDVTAAPRARRLPPLVSVARDDLFQAFDEGRLDDESYALYRARSLFSLGSIRHRFGRVVRPEPHDATLILRDLAVRLRFLTGTERDIAERLLARPTDRGSDPEGTGYSVPEAPPVCSEDVCTHYVATSADAPDATDSDGDRVPDYVESIHRILEQTWAAEIDDRGYRAPKPDARSTNDGGDGRFDLYVADVGSEGIYGYCTSDDPNLEVASYRYYDYSAYCVVDDDFSSVQFPLGASGLDASSVTVAHEFFHAVQFGYDLFEDPWLQEATATWIEDEVFDDINDNLQYLDASPLSDPAVPLDTFFDNDGRDPISRFQYGTWIFFRFLSERFGPDVVRRIWEKADGSRGGEDQYSIQAVADAVQERGASFREVFDAFGSHSVDPASFFEEGASYPRPTAAASHSFSSATPSVSARVTLDHLTRRQIALRSAPGISDTAKLTVKVDLPDRGTGSAASLVTASSGTFEIVSIDLDRSGAGSTTVAFGPSVEASLVLSNGSTRLTGCFEDATPYSCGGGTPTDDGRIYAFSASLGHVAPRPPGGSGNTDTLAPRITRVSDGPDPFSPNGDGVRDRTTIRWTLGEAATTSVGIYVRNGTRKVVSLGSGTTRKGRYFVRWNGRRAGGRLVRRGTYSYKIVAVDAAGNRRIATGTITVRR